MIDVVFFAYDDFANVGFEFVESLKAIGIGATGLKCVDHPFNYVGELPVARSEWEFFACSRSVPNIIYMQSVRVPVGAVPKDRRYKKLFLFVGDQEYRFMPERTLSFYPSIERLFYQTGELAGFSPYPESWLLPAIDTDFIKTRQDYSYSGPIRVQHTPRDPNAKGSVHINNVMYKLQQDPELKNKFIYTYRQHEKVSWIDNIHRMDDCDIYIESQAYTIDRKGDSRILGEFGVTAMECASLSKIVVTCFNSYDKYTEEFKNEAAIYPANSEEQLEATMRKLLILPREQVRREQEKTRQWVVNYHGRKATGLRLKTLLDIQ